MELLTFLVEKALIEGDQLNRFLSLRLRRVSMLFLVISLITGTTLLVAQDIEKAYLRLRLHRRLRNRISRQRTTWRVKA